MMMFLWPDGPRDVPNEVDRSARCESCRLLLQSLSQSVFDSADCVLNLASGLFIPALDLKFGVAGDFADSFLHRAFGLLDRSLDAIFVHALIL